MRLQFAECGALRGERRTGGEPLVPHRSPHARECDAANTENATILACRNVVSGPVIQFDGSWRGEDDSWRSDAARGCFAVSCSSGGRGQPPAPSTPSWRSLPPSILHFCDRQEGAMRPAARQDAARGTLMPSSSAGGCSSAGTHWSAGTLTMMPLRVRGFTARDVHRVHTACACRRLVSVQHHEQAAAGVEHKEPW